jgi:hypothetical protein
MFLFSFTYKYIIYIYESYIYRCLYSPATLYQNCNAIGALLSEICDFEQTPHKRSYMFIYIDVEESRPPVCSSGHSSWLQIKRYGFD